MNLFGWWRRRQQQASPKGVRLIRLLTEEEVRLWRTLEANSPAGRRTLPMVPLGLLVEGPLNEELAGEVIPFVEVTADGFPTAAFFHQRTPAFELLEGLSVQCRLLREPNASATIFAQTPLGEQAPSTETEDKSPPASANASSENQEEDSQGKKLETAAADLAQLWWRGEIHEIVRLPKGQGSENRTGEEEPKAKEPKPKEREPEERPTKGKAASPEHKGQHGEKVPRCPLCGAEMVLKVAKKGKMAGQEFWSCSRYPECKGTRPKKGGESEGGRPAP